MKMQFSRRNRIFLFRSWRPLLLFVGVLLLLLVVRLSFPNFFLYVTSPIYSLGRVFSETAGYMENAKLLREQVTQLSEERDALLEENVRLKDELSSLEALPSDEGIVVRVEARPPVTPYDVLIISAGTDAGIETGRIVYSRGGTPVGTIADAGKHFSRVSLFSSYGVSTEGWIGEDAYPVTFIGEGAGAFVAKVPREATIEEGDIAYISSRASAFGSVVKIHKDASMPEAILEIRPYINPFSLLSVSVARNAP